MKVSWMLIVKQRHLRKDLLNYRQIEHYVEGHFFISKTFAQLQRNSKNAGPKKHVISSIATLGPELHVRGKYQILN
jgi:hypothetical protein